MEGEGWGGGGSAAGKSTQPPNNDDNDAVANQTFDAKMRLV